MQHERKTEPGKSEDLYGCADARCFPSTNCGLVRSDTLAVVAAWRLVPCSFVSGHVSLFGHDARQIACSIGAKSVECSCNTFTDPGPHTLGIEQAPTCGDQDADDRVE